MSQKGITQNPKACQEKCKKNSWINFAMNSVIFVLTIINRAILRKHSAKFAAYLFRQVFLHERLHWGKKSAASTFGVALEAFVVILLEWALAGGSFRAGQWASLLRWGRDRGWGRQGLPTEELLILQSRTSVQHQNLCSDLRRPGMVWGPPELLLCETSSQTQRGLELV